MSNIFDALQRLEVERSGTAGSPLPAITELLERAERSSASRSAAAQELERLAAADSLDREREYLPGKPALVPEVEILPEVVPAAGDGNAEIFREFQTLHLSVTPQNRLVAVSDSDSPAAEAFRLLSVRLRHLRRERNLKKVLITSTIPQEGKSMVSANLACALAASTRRKILLLEGDVRRPSLSKVFGLSPYPGLCEWLQGGRSLASSIYRLEPGGIWLFPAGDGPVNPLELLESPKLPALMEELAAIFDWVIIDSPPVLPLADTSVWTRLADGIILVTRQGTTQKRHLQRGLEALESKKVIGAVVNSSKSSADNDYYSYRRPAEGSAAN
ncbi:MAG: CpsD/CapB family tyrosine-protein kinase [Acidobacteriaceae bacterium]|jgi:capsular exopolysaccharide synthesis family protein